MGKLLGRLLIVVAIYVVAYVGVRMGGVLEKTVKPSQTEPGKTLYQIEAAEGKPGIVKTLFTPCALCENIYHNMGKAADNRQDAQDKVNEAIGE